MTDKIMLKVFKRQMTVQDLLDELEGLSKDLPVFFEQAQHDYVGTVSAEPVTGVEFKWVHYDSPKRSILDLDREIERDDGYDPDKDDTVKMAIVIN